MTVKTILLRIALVLLLAGVLGCTNDPQPTEIGESGYFVTDTLYQVEIRDYFEKTDTLNTLLLENMIFANTPAFKSKLIFLIPADGEVFRDRVITSVKIAIRGDYYVGPDLDSTVRCMVYPIRDDWGSNRTYNWDQWQELINYDRPIGYLEMTDSVGTYDTLRVTDMDLFKFWQDSSLQNYGFIVEFPMELPVFEKSYTTGQSFAPPTLYFTYKDSLNATEEKSATTSLFDDLYIFLDNTSDIYHNPNYYYLRTMVSSSLLLQVTLDSLKQRLEKDNGLLINARMYIPVELSESFYSAVSRVDYGIYPLKEGWKPDSLVRQSNFTSISRLALFNKIKDGYLTFESSLSETNFAGEYLQGTVSGTYENHGWVVQPYKQYQAYEVLAIPRYGSRGFIVYTYWVPPQSRY